MKKTLLIFSVLLASLLCGHAAEKFQASGSTKIKGTGQAQDGGLFGGIQKDTEYVARTNAIIDAVDRAMEGQSDAIRKLFKDNWGKKTGSDRHGADDFIQEKIVTDSSASGVLNVDKKTRTVTYAFVGTLDLKRLLEILGGNEKSKLVPLVFYSMRETSEEQTVIISRGTERERKKLQEVEGQLASKDDSTLKTEALHLREKISATETEIKKANNFKFAISDIGPRKAFGGQVKASLNDLGFEEFVDGALNDLSKTFNEANATGAEIEPSLLRSMTRAAIDEEADYVIIMNIDFQFPQKSGLTGAFECAATATGDVYKKPDAESKRAPRTVATLDPIIIKGSGSSEQEAKRTAAIMVAKDAAQDIAAKLRSKNKL